MFELEDCRSATFSKEELKFRIFELNFRNGSYYSPGERNLVTLGTDLGRLLAHELAHALDYTYALDLDSAPNLPISDDR